MPAAGQTQANARIVIDRDVAADCAVLDNALESPHAKLRWRRRDATILAALLPRTGRCQNECFCMTAAACFALDAPKPRRIRKKYTGEPHDGCRRVVWHRRPAGSLSGARGPADHCCGVGTHDCDALATRDAGRGVACCGAGQDSGVCMVPSCRRRWRRLGALALCGTLGRSGASTDGGGAAGRHSARQAVHAGRSGGALSTLSR